MRIFTKIATAIATLLAVVGIICIILSFFMGLKLETVRDMIHNGAFSIGPHTFHYLGLDWDIFDDDKEELRGTLQGECDKMEIEFGAGELEVIYADVDSIQVLKEGNAKVSSYVEEGTLHIESGGKIGIGNQNGKVLVQIPKNYVFREVELEMGAGEARVENLKTEELQIQLGAGEIELVELSTNIFEAEVGAGELQVEIVGSEKDYGYDIECGIGEIQIGENSYGGLGESQKNINAGTGKRIDLECGIGEIEINFTK